MNNFNVIKPEELNANAFSTIGKDWLLIAVVVLTHKFFTGVFREEDLPPEEQERYGRELWAGAVEIGETVLYVKQHSVNCIPAALYMMIHLLRGQFTIQDAIFWSSSKKRWLKSP